MSKGSTRRPGVITDTSWDAIFKPRLHGGKCPICHENTPKCICARTEDGPGQEDAKDDRGNV